MSVLWLSALVRGASHPCLKVSADPTATSGEPCLIGTSSTLVLLCTIVIIIATITIITIISTAFEPDYPLASFCSNCQICQNCHSFSKLTKFVKIVRNSQKFSKILKTVFVGQVLSPRHFDQMSQRSQVSGVALCMSKVKVPWVSEWLSDKVTYLAVLDNKKVLSNFSRGWT